MNDIKSETLAMASLSNLGQALMDGETAELRNFSRSVTGKLVTVYKQNIAWEMQTRTKSVKIAANLLQFHTNALLLSGTTEDLYKLIAIAQGYAMHREDNRVAEDLEQHDILDDIGDAIAISDGIEAKEVGKYLDQRSDDIKEASQKRQQEDRDIADIECYRTEVARLQHELDESIEDLDMAKDDLKHAEEYSAKRSLEAAAFAQLSDSGVKVVHLDSDQDSFWNAVNEHKDARSDQS